MKPSSSPAASLRRARLHLGLLLRGPKTTAAASPPPPGAPSGMLVGGGSSGWLSSPAPLGFRSRTKPEPERRAFEREAPQPQGDITPAGKGLPGGGQRGLSPSWGRCLWVPGGVGAAGSSHPVPPRRSLAGYMAVPRGGPGAVPSLGCRTVTGGSWGGGPAVWQRCPPPLRPNLPGASPSTAVLEKRGPPDPPGGSASPRV